MKDMMAILEDISERILRIEIRMSNMESWMKQKEELYVAADVLTIEELKASKARAERMYSEVRGVTPEAERMRSELRKRIHLLEVRIQRAEVADYEEEVAAIIRNEG